MELLARCRILTRLATLSRSWNHRRSPRLRIRASVAAGAV